MKNIANYLVLLLVVIFLAPFTFAATRKVEGYRCIRLQGHPVWISKEFIAKDPELLKKVIQAVSSDLKMLDTSMPPAAREAIRTTALWLELETEPFGTVSGKGAVYHPSRQWLKDHGKEPAMVKGIQICSARNYLQWRQDKVGMTVLHELSHAFYHLLENDRYGVKAAFEVAKRKGIYNQVGYMHSDEITGKLYRAYAMNNAHEYFAELSESYFGCNDYFPYNRQQLQRHDPLGYDVIHKIWNVPAKYIRQQKEDQTVRQSEEAFNFSNPFNAN